MPIIKLQSSDGEVFEVDVEIAKQSVTIKTMLEDLGMDEDEDEPVPLPNVNAAILKKVIQWCTFHKEDPPPPEDDENKEKRTDDICSWDAEFLKVDQGTLFELILAANYLDIKGLLDVTCKTVANMIKGKSPEEIRKTFNIKNDFTPAEEEQHFKDGEPTKRFPDPELAQTSYRLETQYPKPRTKLTPSKRRLQPLRVGDSDQGMVSLSGYGRKMNGVRRSRQLIQSRMHLIAGFR